MGGFLSKLFGGGKKKEGAAAVESLIVETLNGIIENGKFELSFKLTHTQEEDEPVVLINLSGKDEELLKNREGELIDSLQLYIKRVVQHHFPEDRTNVQVDCGGFREESNQALVDLAEKLKGIAIEKNKSVYCRALSPKDRKIVHQYLASDTRVKSRSIGEGLFKKIKIYPAKGNFKEERQPAD